MKKHRLLIVMLAGAGMLAGGVAAAQAGPGMHGPDGGKRFMLKKLMRADANGDGVLTRDELQQARQKRFAALDANGDGKVETAEIDKAIMRRLERRKVRLRYRMLGRLDANGDGIISREEFLGSGGRLFRMADVNGDGKVTREELMRLRQMGRGGKHARAGCRKGKYGGRWPGR